MIRGDNINYKSTNCAKIVQKRGIYCAVGYNRGRKVGRISQEKIHKDISVFQNKDKY